jgi:glycosyltransferase involved in cell wall biosynthesis
MRSGGFDLVVSDFVLPAVNLPARPPCPSVVFTHNVESEIWRRHAETKTGGLMRSLYRTQYRRMLRFEARALSRFDGVLAVSAADAETLRRLYPDLIQAPIHVVQTGVDTEFFRPVTTAVTPKSLVFTGSMDWLPNEDAMLFFYREILPRIREQEPDVSLTIVGRAPTPAVARLAQDPAITVTGRVDDVRPHLANGAVYIVPLRIGGGTRLKIFEAMAMGKAVVSTAVGAEGLPVRDGEHLLLADAPDAFASAVVRLFRDHDRRRAIETAARSLVVTQYDWAAVATDLDRALTSVAREASAARAPANEASGLLAPRRIDMR